jgi:phosphoglycolate phosphatase
MKDVAIFDVDGTLVDTRNAVFLLMNETLAHFGLRTITQEEYDPLFGMGAYGMSAGVLRIAAGSDRLIDEFMGVMLENYRQDPMQNTRYFTGIPKLLEQLYSFGITIAALSNKPDNINNLIIESAFDRDLFAYCLGHKPEFPLKPDPHMLYILMDKLGVDPQNCVLIGDTPIDVKTAQNAGILSLATLWGGYDEVALRKAGADVIAATPEEVFKFFVGE